MSYLILTPETTNMIHTPHSNSTPPDRIYNTTRIDMPGERYFQFFVKTSGEARVLLADDTVWPTYPSLHDIIQTFIHTALLDGMGEQFGMG